MTIGYGRGAYGSGPYGSSGSAGPSPDGGLLDDVVGPLALAITLGGQVVPLTDAGRATIRHGRTGPDRQPDAATLTLAVRIAALAQLPVLGEPVDLALGADANDWLLTAPGVAWSDVRTRFTGTVTDVEVGSGIVEITAVSRRAPLGRAYIGDVPWPAESDGARAARILAAAAAWADFEAGPHDAGAVTVLARDVDRQPALGVLDQLAVDTGGVLAERRDGPLLWHDTDHRQATTPVVTLTPAQVLAPAKRRQGLSGLVNDLTVGYGAPQASIRVVDEDSVATYGPYPASVSTQLATVDDADTFARTIVARRSRPRWSTPGLTVDLLRTVDRDAAALLLSLEFADLLAVDGFPADGPFVTADLWVEGWTETIGRNEWRLALDVSDYRLTATPLRWSDVPPDLRWLDVPPDLRWLDAQSAENLT